MFVVELLLALNLLLQVTFSIVFKILLYKKYCCVCIFSAAYCVTLPINATIISLDLFDVFVAAGKFYNSYDASLDINVQKRQVRISIP